MAQVTLNINQQPYAIACADDEVERLELLGTVVSERVAELSGSLGQVGDAKLILLAALTLLDEAKVEMDKLANEAEADATEIANIAAAVAKLEDIAENIESA
jgi:cell division protein ZapA